MLVPHQAVGDEACNACGGLRSPVLHDRCLVSNYKRSFRHTPIVQRRSGFNCSLVHKQGYNFGLAGLCLRRSRMSPHPYSRKRLLVVVSGRFDERRTSSDSVNKPKRRNGEESGSLSNNLTNTGGSWTESDAAAAYLNSWFKTSQDTPCSTDEGRRCEDLERALERLKQDNSRPAYRYAKQKCSIAKHLTVQLEIAVRRPRFDARWEDVIVLLKKCWW